MKAVILAAGMGTRLAPYDDHPKTLTLLANGETILKRLLSSLEAIVGKENIIIVVGYKKEMIQEYTTGVSLLFNPDFAVQNTSKSLLLALQQLDDDLLWVNGDVVFKHSLLNEFLEKRKTAMVVNQLPVGEEEVKYRTNGMGQILEISKQVKQGEGEALGLNFFERKNIPLLKKGLELCRNEDFFEKAIQYAIDEGVEVLAYPVGRDMIAEVDFLDDLQKVNRIINNDEN